jgi:hypothetical protein
LLCGEAWVASVGVAAEGAVVFLDGHLCDSSPC